MKHFVFGVIFTLLVLFLGGLAYLMLGFAPTSADAQPSSLERRIAMSAVDASMERHAPRVNSPVPATPENLIEGMKIYTLNCAGCHGDLTRKRSDFGASFYPPAPQLIVHPVGDPDWHIYYTVRTGVRLSGMPAWTKILRDDEMWKVTLFLANLEKLPQPVQDYWKRTVVTSPEGSSEGK
jgi:mono/diheme cytochrome c family protein